MGQLLLRWNRPFRRGVGIYASTIPFTEIGAISVDTTFIVRGVNFDLLPNELVLVFDEDEINTMSDTRRLIEVDRGVNYVVFRPIVSFAASVVHSWRFLAYPFSAPRSFIEYNVI